MLRMTGGKDLHLCNDILRYHRSRIDCVLV